MAGTKDVKELESVNIMWLIKGAISRKFETPNGKMYL